MAEDVKFIWSLFQTSAVREKVGRLATGTSGSMKNISQEKLFQIWPTFIEEAEGKLMWEILAGKIK